MSKRCFVGYHGTSAWAASKIIASREFKVIDDPKHWLGPGVYFSEDDVRQAYNWCTKVKRFTQWAIVHCDIQAENVIDLLLLEDLDEFERIALALGSRYRELNGGRQPPPIMNTDILNVIYKMSEYDLVRGIFPIPKRKQVAYTNVIPMQVQLCVRNHDCIKTMKEVRYEP